MFEYPTYVKSTLGNNCTVADDFYPCNSNSFLVKILPVIKSNKSMNSWVRDIGSAR